MEGKVDSLSLLLFDDVAQGQNAPIFFGDAAACSLQWLDVATGILEPKTMKMFVERTTGQVLALRVERGALGGYSYDLYEPDSDRFVATVLFQYWPQPRELWIRKLGVLDHENSATARNPNPGVGRLLMYLACKHAVRQGVKRLRLWAVESASPFYRLMGMHHLVIDSSVPTPVRSVNGKLSAEWLEEFDGYFASTRCGGILGGELRTVLSCIEGKTLKQWQQRSVHSCCSMM